MRTFITLVCLFVVSLPLYSAQRKFVNGSFENPEVTLSRGWQLFQENTVPGWDTTDASGNIELWEGLFGIVAPDGDQITEMNSNSTANLFQTVCLSSGETIDWSFWHKGRTGNETVRLDFGSQTITTVTTGSAGTLMTQYSGSTVYTGASGNQALTFVSVSSGGGASLGNLLDHVVISLPPLVEFLAPTNGSIEGTGDDIPRLRLNGELFSAASVDVIVTGGSATNGTDFSLIQTVNIPAGDYDETAATSIPINLTINNTFDLESSENITLALANPTGGVRIADANCDGTEVSTNTYTITDDDEFVDITVNKDDSNVQYVPGSGGIYVITVTNIGPGDVLNAVVQDVLPNGLTLNGTVTCSASSPSSCTITSGTSTAISVNVSLESGSSAQINIPVLFSANPNDYIPYKACLKTVISI